MKEKLRKVTKYVAVLLLAICIMETPTEASAAVTTGTEFTDERFAEETYVNKPWIYIKSESNGNAFIVTPKTASDEFVVDITSNGEGLNFVSDSELLFTDSSGNVNNGFDIGNGIYVPGDKYIVCGGTGNVKVTFDGEVVYPKLEEPEVTPEPTPSETTDGVQFRDIFDVAIVDVLINILKKMTHLFMIFPINVVMIASICGFAFGLLGKAKRTATNK